MKRELEAILLTAILIFPASSARAAEHGIQGCVLVEDTRNGVSTAGALVGLENLKVTFTYKTALGDLPAVGSLRTNSSGCYNGSISGFTVPESTQISATATLEDNEWVVTAGRIFSVYQIDLGRKSVGSGGTANFGDITLESTDRDQELHAAALTWLNGKQARSLFDAHIGNFPGGQVTIEVPTTDSISNAGYFGIRLTSDAVKDFNDVFLHEFGHVINSRNNILNTFNDYCARKEHSDYPKNRPPYTYIDPDEASGTSDPAKEDACGHSLYSAENERESITEGFADAFADWLSDRKCRNFSSGYDYDLNFDGNNREMNQAGYLCDLVDNDSSNTPYLHVFGEEGHLSLLPDLGAGEVPFVSGEQAWLPIGTEIHELDLAAKTSKKIGDLKRNGYVRIPKVVRAGQHTCALGNYRENYIAFDLVCRASPATAFDAALTAGSIDLPPGPSNQTAPAQNPSSYSINPGVLKNNLNPGSTDLESAPYSRKSGNGWTVIRDSELPDPTFNLYDIDVSEDRIYVFGSVDGGDSVLYSAASASFPFEWREDVHINGWGNQPTKIAVDAPKKQLYMSLRGTILRCEFNRCSGGGTRFAGSDTEIGYRRGSRSNVLFDIIDNLFVASGGLFVQDDYGVARIDLASGQVDQFVGPSIDPVFTNNLALRSLDLKYSEGSILGFHSDGSMSLFSGGYYESDVHRNRTAKSGTWLADHSKKVTTETYCGTDPVSRPASEVFHLHKKAARGDPDADQLHEALRQSTTLSDSSLNAVKKANWVKLSQSGCSFTTQSEVTHVYESSALGGQPGGQVLSQWGKPSPAVWTKKKPLFERLRETPPKSTCGGALKQSEEAERSRRPLLYDKPRKPQAMSGEKKTKQRRRAQPATYPPPVRLRGTDKQ